MCRRRLTIKKKLLSRKKFIQRGLCFKLCGGATRVCVSRFTLKAPQTCLSFVEILSRKLKIHTLLQTHTDLTFMCMFYAVDLSQCDVMSCDANFSKVNPATELSCLVSDHKAITNEDKRFVSRNHLSLTVAYSLALKSRREILFSISLSAI